MSNDTVLSPSLSSPASEPKAPMTTTRSAYIDYTIIYSDVDEPERPSGTCYLAGAHVEPDVEEYTANGYDGWSLELWQERI